MPEEDHNYGLTPDAAKFVRFVTERSQPTPTNESLPRVQTDELSSSIARLYEQARNTVDNSDTHLLRRNAIHRFLRRHVLAYGTRSGVGELLIRDLIRSGYIPTNTFPESEVQRINAIVGKYRALAELLQQRLSDSPRALAIWVLGLASAEIEQAIYDPAREEALIHYAFGELKARIHWEDDAFAPEERDLQLYIALHRSVFKSDSRLIEYHLLASYYPGWNQATAADVQALALHVLHYRDQVRQQLDHPSAPRLTRRVRRMVIPFQVLLDAIEAHPDDALERMTDEKRYITDTVAVIEKRYAANRKSTRRSTMRSIAFIFFTKMLLAIALEVPYDLFVSGMITFIPLSINVLFHPLFLLALGTSVRFPGKDNSKRIVADLWATLRHDRRAGPYYIRLAGRQSITSSILLGLVYALTFVITVGGLIWLLAWLRFSWLDATLFLFFFSIVTFVGIRLRIRAGEYFMVRRRESFLGAIFLFLASPLVEVGHWVTTKFRRYNLFLFFFDIVLEAPFKALVFAIEEWFNFARERSERITD